MAIPVFIWAREISSIISNDPDVVAEMVSYLRISMLSEPFMAVSVILAGSLTGAGDTKGAMLAIVSTHLIPCIHPRCSGRVRGNRCLDRDGHVNILSGDRDDPPFQKREVEGDEAVITQPFPSPLRKGIVVIPSRISPPHNGHFLILFSSCLPVIFPPLSKRL